MRVPLTWLATFVRLPDSVDELADRLTVAGLAVEAVEQCGEVDRRVYAGRIESVEPHPNAERLVVCSVRGGDGSPVTIVSGAPGLRRGQVVPVAPPGAQLAAGITVEAKVLRGVASEGVVCSAAELGLGTEADRLLALPRGTRAGMPVVEIAGVRDTVLTVDVTPNRGDCLSILGIAREVAAATGTRVRSPRLRAIESVGDAPVDVTVVLEDGEGAPRYTARVVRGLRGAVTPLWLRLRLERAGMRSVDPIVDAANHVMLETGQPLHTFDRARLVGDRIIVRRARAGESIETIDGVERRLVPSDVVIADGEGPIAIAGIMGGRRTAVDASTTSLLLESAHFSPVAVRRTSRRLGLSSEASYRFERFVDPMLVRPALDALGALLKRLAGGRVAPGVECAEAETWLPQPVSIRVRPARVGALLGTEMTSATVRRRLRAIGAAADRDGAELRVTPPTSRPDLAIEADVVEEVARIGGYDAIPATMPRAAMRGGVDTEARRLVARIRAALTGQGVTEAVTSPFLPASIDEAIAGWTGRDWATAQLMNPLSTDHAVLRRTPVASLLRAVRLNVDRGAEFVALFEIGKGFGVVADGERREERALGMVLAGRWPAKGVERSGPGVEFADGKGILENLFAALGSPASDVTFAPPEEGAVPALWHPAQAAVIRVCGRPAGVVGTVHPRVAQVLELSAKTQVAEVDFKVLSDYRPARSLRPLPRYPAITRDIAVVVEEEFRSEAVLEEIGRLNHPLIESARLFDCYRGHPIPAGKKSLAYTVAYRATDRTLTDDEVVAAHGTVRARLLERFALDLRS